MSQFAVFLLKFEEIPIFKIKGPTDNLKTTVNPVKTITPRFITRALEEMKKKKTK